MHDLGTEVSAQPEIGMEREALALASEHSGGIVLALQCVVRFPDQTEMSQQVGICRMRQLVSP